MRPLRFHPAALDELDAATAYLDDERRGHGDLFFDEVSRRVTQAARFPSSGAPVPGLPRELDVRAFTARVFRYRIITAVIAGERTVIAVAHENREPGYWYDRAGM